MCYDIQKCLAFFFYPDELTNFSLKIILSVTIFFTMKIILADINIATPTHH